MEKIEKIVIGDDQRRVAQRVPEVAIYTEIQDKINELVEAVNLLTQSN